MEEWKNGGARGVRYGKVRVSGESALQRLATGIVEINKPNPNPVNSTSTLPYSSSPVR